MFDWPSKTANLDQLGSLRCHECADKNICTAHGSLRAASSRTFHYPCTTPPAAFRGR